MKILNIHIYNLASLEGEVTIDFTTPPLDAAGIFAITGATGAGKSTILDALCLALYARTPRYVQAREAGVYVKDAQGSAISQSDPRGILRDGAGEGSAAVTFIGVDKQTYRAMWQVRRAKGKAEGNLLNYTVRLKNIGTGADVPGTRTVLQKEIERLIGLNFEQFTRSVLLAQGDFTAFLKAGKDEKSALLEKLTGTQIYSEISQNIYLHYKAEESKLNELKTRQSAVSLLKESEIEEIESIVSQIDTNLQEVDTKLGGCQKELAWHEKAVELNSLIAIAHQHHQNALTEKQNIQPRQQKLQLAEAVQPTRSWADQWLAHQELLNNKTELNKSLVAELTQLQAKKTTHLQQLDIVQKKVITLTEQKDRVKPQLETAKMLDIQLKEKTKVVDQFSTRLGELIKKQQIQDNQQAELNKRLKTLQIKAGQTQDWLVKNKSRQPIADQGQLILSKLQDAKQYLTEEQLLNQAIAEVRVEVSQKEAAFSNQQETLLKITQAINNGQQTTALLDAKIAAVSIDKLEQEQTDLAQSGKENMRAESHWKLLSALREAQQNEESRLLNCQQQQIKNNEQLQFLEPTIRQTLIQKNTTRDLLDKARIVAATSVTDLRSQLVSGDPCPVCGSKEHPFADVDIKADLILANHTESLKELEQQYNEQLANQTQLIAYNKNLDEQIRELTLLIESGKQALIQAENTWQGFSFVSHLKEATAEEISQLLKKWDDSQQANERILAEKFKYYQGVKHSLDSNNESIQTLNKQLIKCQQEAATTASDLRSFESAIEHNQNQNQQAQNKLKGLKAEIDRYFPNEAWYENWKSDPIPFQKSITDFAAQWSKYLEESKQQKTELETLAVKSADLKIQIAEHLTALTDWQKQTNAALLNYEEDLQKRKALFGGEPVMKVEEQLESSWKNILLQQETLQQEITANEKVITRYATQIDSTQKDMDLSSIRLTEFSEKLDNWLISYNQAKPASLKETTRQELFELLTLGQDWIESEKVVITQINQEAENASGTLKSRRSDLTQHQERKTTIKELPDLQAEEQRLKIQLEELRDKKSSQLTILRIDREQKGKLHKILKEIENQEKTFENWAKLNSLIGSADGKKFRQIAQEYTLDALLQYANHHLKTLSKRYLLQRIPDTLALQILDQDMGDEVRTVYSLSGGESFLVSLSLALGLASLSSSRLKVESLFIDEGFGSLDASTLNIAMDALERLHDQGRKVGVISHVQELTERIPVQIMVHKQPSGKSTIEILSY